MLTKYLYPSLFILFLTIQLACARKCYTLGEPIDGDGNRYKTVVIGAQEWFSENLKTTHYNDGEAINTLPINRKSDSYYWYNNDTLNKEIYGALYTWKVAKSKKVCPCGWKVPSKKDWEELEHTLSIKYLNIAKALASNNQWNKSKIPNSIGYKKHLNNTTGFSALPAGGLRAKDRKYRLAKVNTAFWTTTEMHPGFIYTPMLFVSRDSIGHPHLVDSGAHPIRCVRKTKNR